MRISAMAVPTTARHPTHAVLILSFSQPFATATEARLSNERSIRQGSRMTRFWIIHAFLAPIAGVIPTLPGFGGKSDAKPRRNGSHNVACKSVNKGDSLNPSPPSIHPSALSRCSKQASFFFLPSTSVSTFAKGEISCSFWCDSLLHLAWHGLRKMQNYKYEEYDIS